MYIRDLRPGGACLVKVIYGPEQRTPPTTGRDNFPGEDGNGAQLNPRQSELGQDMEVDKDKPDELLERMYIRDLPGQEGLASQSHLRAGTT